MIVKGCDTLMNHKNRANITTQHLQRVCLYCCFILYTNATEL